LDIVNDCNAQRIINILDVCGLQQHVCEATHIHGHSLHVVVARYTSCIMPYAEVTDPG